MSDGELSMATDTPVAALKDHGVTDNQIKKLKEMGSMTVEAVYEMSRDKLKLIKGFGDGTARKVQSAAAQALGRDLADGARVPSGCMFNSTHPLSVPIYPDVPCLALMPKTARSLHLIYPLLSIDSRRASHPPAASRPAGAPRARHWAQEAEAREARGPARQQGLTRRHGRPDASDRRECQRQLRGSVGCPGRRRRLRVRRAAVRLGRL